MDPDATGRAGNRQPAGGGLGAGELQLGQGPQPEQGHGGAPGFGSFWERWKWRQEQRDPGSRPSPTCTAHIRLALEVWDFSRDCQDSPGTLPDFFSRDAKLRLSGSPWFPRMEALSCPPTSAGQGSRAPPAGI